MASRNPDANGPTYPLGVVSRLTGISSDLLRAWERRYGVVQPLRTAGGTRRYRAAELERLRLVKAAVDAGHRISRVARLDLAELKRCAADASDAPTGRFEAVLLALDRLDAVEAERILSLQLGALGPHRFARDFALPLAVEIGERWASDQLCVASEHLGSGVLRSLLGASLRATAVSAIGPRVVFATPTGERHELGVLMAALTSVGAGANPVYLGPDLPVDEILTAADRTRASAVAIGLVALPRHEAQEQVVALRSGLPDSVFLWLGGAIAVEIELPPGVEHITNFESLEQRSALLGARFSAGS